MSVFGTIALRRKEEKEAVIAIRCRPTGNHRAIRPAMHLHGDGCGRGLNVVVSRCPWSWLRLKPADADRMLVSTMGASLLG